MVFFGHFVPSRSVNTYIHTSHADRQAFGQTIGGVEGKGAALLRRARNFLPTSSLHLSLLPSRRIFPSKHFEGLLDSVPVKEKSKAT